MISVDLNDRVDLPYTVGSTSREGRLHLLMDQTISRRRSFPRDSLPKLTKSYSTVNLANTKAIEEEDNEGQNNGKAIGKKTIRIVRRSSMAEFGSRGGPTSVSCPGGIGHLREETEDSSAYITKGGMNLSKKERRMPPTSNPRMARQKTKAVLSLEKLPPVISEDGGTSNDKESGNVAPRLPKVAAGERAATKLQNINLRITQRRRSKTETETVHRQRRQTTDGAGAGEDGGERDDHVEDQLQRFPRSRPRRRSETRHRRDGTDSDESDDDRRKEKPHKPRRKKSLNMKRQSTVGHLPVPSTEEPRSSRRSTLPPSAKFQWYRPRFVKQGEALSLFRRSVRKVALVLSWFKSLSKKQDSMDQTLKSFLDMAKELEECTNTQDIEERSGLAFDPKHFCAKKEVYLSEDARNILTTPSRGRTPEMIQKVLSVLQNLKAFAEYPLHMQQKFAKVAWFQEVPQKRIILKQGHYAENFYFILAGKAIVKKITVDEHGGGHVMRAVARMQSGQSFGEVALLHQSVRTATVESATDMHILVITREDFQRIFFNTLDGQAPEHIIFCKNQVGFLQDFPLDLSMTIPGTCLFHFFRPGAVVVPDSKKNEWIYIVRSGSCQILKRLDAVNARRPWSERKLDLRIKLPRNGTAEPAPRIDTRLRLPDPMYNQQADDSEDDLSSYHSEDFEDFEAEREPIVDEQLSPPDGDERPPVRVTRFSLPRRPVTCGDTDIPPMAPIQEVAEIASNGNENKKRKQPPKSAPAPTKSPRINPDQPGYSKSKLFFLPEIKKAYIERDWLDTPMMPAHWAYLDDDDDDRMTLADAMTIDARSTRSMRTVKQPPENSKPSCYVQLKKLRPRDAFGLEMIKFDDDKAYDIDSNTSVTLVSNGCELIMLSRKFFERHATEHSKQHIREKVRPYPADDALQHNLQIEVNWNLFRKDTVGDFLDLVRQSRELSVS